MSAPELTASLVQKLPDRCGGSHPAIWDAACPVKLHPGTFVGNVFIELQYIYGKA